MGRVRYVTVFSAIDHPFKNWWLPAFGLIFIGIGLIGFLAPTLFAAVSSSRFTSSSTTRWGFLLFGAFWTIGVGFCTATDSWSATNALKSGDYLTVEGRVSDFTPMPRGGHAEESFTVNGVHFAYSDFEIQAGFNHTSSYGGPIREGLPVRIAYRDGEILRLEVGR